MSKYRCPICGATHKEQPVKCRLCGQNLTSESAVPNYTGGTKVVVEDKKGLGGIMLIAIGGVVVLGLLALALGLAPSNSFIDKVRDKIPGLQAKSGDGWQAIDEPDGAFTATWPAQPEKRFIPYPAAAADRMTMVVAPLGTETELSVSYGKVTRQNDESAKAALQRFGDLWAQQTGFKIDTRTETSFAGYPALMIEGSGGHLNDKPAYQKALLVLKGDELYVIQSVSIYKDHPQFPKVVNGVTFT